MRYLLCLALLAGASSMSAPATAQPANHGPSAADRATARRLATEGQIALKKGDFDTAADRFERANELLAAPTFLVRLARARVGQGRLVEAYEIYRKVIRDGVEPDKPEAFKRALADAKQEVKQVEPRLAWVTVNVTGADSNEAEVSLNGAVIPNAALGAERPVDPGTLHAKAIADGYRTAEADVPLAEGAHVTRELRLVPLPKAEPGPVVSNNNPPVMSDDGGESSFWSQRTVGYVTLGLGGAGLALGAVTGILALEQHQDLVNIKCAQLVGNHCYVADKTDKAKQYATDKKQEMDRFAKIATISFIAGGAVAATGLILLLTAPEASGAHASEPAFLPYVGFGTIGAVGSF